jgi:uncharacterized NAD(P)/FAD-binding protein YdhS
VRFDIAILGAGFSGAMVVTHLVRETQTPLRIALIDPAFHAPKGAAYSTMRREHLLNVRANQMGAFPDAPEDFWRWLNGRAEANAFVPRMWYGDYLAEIYEKTSVLAAERSIAIERMAWPAQRIHALEGEYLIEDAAGETLCAKQLVLATGNQLPPSDTQGVIRIPWGYDYTNLPTQKDAPIWIIGSGLTAVDTVVSLKRAGYQGNVIMLSRHALLPQAHPALPSPVLAYAPQVLAGQPLSRIMHHWRVWAKAQIAQGASWQATIDALRPYTVALWQSLPLEDRARFFRHLWSRWNAHRHRMAPEIAGELTSMQQQEFLTLRRGSALALDTGAVTWRDMAGAQQRSEASLIFDCRGPRYQVEAMPWLADLLRESIIHAAPVGYGLRLEAPYRVSTAGHPPLYALGPLLLGELLETTAVPELRTEARDVARLLLA